MHEGLIQKFWNNYIWNTRATNLEDPNTTINGFTLSEIFGAPPSLSGEKVDEKTAMTFSAVFRATSIISGIISYLPFKIYSKTLAGREEVITHPYWDIFTKQPSIHYTKPVYFERAINHYLNWGNHLAEIKKYGTSIYFDLIHPKYLKEIKINSRGMLVYVIEGPNGKKEIRQDSIIHVPNLGDELIGKGVIASARDDIGLEFARRRYGSQYFKDGGKPKSFISTDQILKESQRMEITTWIREQKQKGHDIMLDSGFKYQNMTIPPEDSQFLGTGEFSIETIARWYGVPKSKLAHSKDPTHNNAESLGIEFLQDTVAPIVHKIETEYTVKVLSSPNYAEFNMDAYLRADTKTRAEQNQISVNAGYKTINEIRKLNNDNPVEGGDRPLVQGAMIHLDQVGTQYGNTQDIRRNKEEAGR